MAETRTYYDQPGSSTPSLTRIPLNGDVTRVEQVRDYTGTNPNWITTMDAAHDPWGRPTAVTDGNGRTTTTTYSQTLGLTTATTVTPPTGSAFAIDTALDPAFGVPLTVTDANDKVTTAQYDSLGRLVKVWRANRSTSLTPDVAYAYSLDGGTTAAYVATTRLGPDGQQITSYEILDGFLRTRQTQRPTADGGAPSPTPSTTSTAARPRCRRSTTPARRARPASPTGPTPPSATSTATPTTASAGSSPTSCGAPTPSSRRSRPATTATVPRSTRRWAAPTPRR
ncbi:hypothetical protein ACFQY4_13865 [Catellatospora bangladeshensis]|uniref:hypothetical protein n=1 Tax=Catellatospora bangladeshensis TaxID=310355 RepID=UPI00361E401D